MIYLARRYYRFIAFVFLLLAGHYGLAQASAQTPSDQSAAKIDTFLTKLTSNNMFSGSVLIAKDGKIILSKGYGLADEENDVLNTTKTKFRIGSLTKQFTAMAILILQERGKLDVQDKICKYVKDCPASWQDITIHHLLTHTSGIPDYTQLPGFDGKITLPMSVMQTIQLFKEKPLEFKPGSRWSYSNSGYHLLGYIIEQASGTRYQVFLRENIFGPLDLKDTDYDNNTIVVKHRAAGYASVGRKARYLDMSLPYSAGGLYSTVEDLYLWDQALYTDKLISKKSLALMFTPFAEVPGAPPFAAYGYGWLISKPKIDHPFVGHVGQIFGFASLIMRYPDDKVTLIVLSNLETTSIDGIQTTISDIVFSKS